jgi:hypothetical protein
MAIDYPGTPFVIKELSGDERELRLTGRALPFRPFSISGSQRINVNWMQGCPEGSATVMGSKEEPTTIRGYWKDKYLNTVGEELVEAGAVNQTGIAGSGRATQNVELAPMVLDGQPVTSVRAACDLLDEIRRMGQLLEVTWGSVTRRGFVEKFSQDWHDLHDVEWQIGFQWINQGERTEAAVFVTTLSSGELANTMRLAYQRMQDVAVPTSFGLKPNLADAVGSFGRALGDLTSQVEDAAANLADLAASPGEAYANLKGILSNEVTECREFEAWLEQRVPSAYAAPTEIGTSAADQAAATETAALNQAAPDPWVMVETAMWRVECLQRVREMRRIAVEQISTLTMQVDGDVVAVYEARSGDDLRDVSRIYYSTPYEWRRIALFNCLVSSELVAGQRVRVPRLTPAELQGGGG